MALPKKTHLIILKTKGVLKGVFIQINILIPNIYGRVVYVGKP